MRRYHLMLVAAISLLWIASVLAQEGCPGPGTGMGRMGPECGMTYAGVFEQGAPGSKDAPMAPGEGPRGRRHLEQFRMLKLLEL